MKQFMPCQGSVLSKYAAETVECLQATQFGSESPSGHLSKDCKRSYIYCGSHLEVLNTSDGHRITTWCYGRGSKSGQHHQIAAAAAAASGLGAAAEILCARAVDDGASRLLLGLGVPMEAAGSLPQRYGLVCLFDVAAGKVIRAAKLPYPVTAVSPVTLHFTGCVRSTPMERWKQSAACGSDGGLTCFGGMAAVGTEHGGVYLLDLCLDDDDAWSSCELTPLCCHVVLPPLDESSSELTEQREHCRGSRMALAVCLLKPRQGRYNYLRPDDQVIKCLDSGRATITCVKFIPEMTSLCVGFAFGCFQLWNMSPLALDYSSRYEENQAAVVAFTHQVPEDDPRNFCYLWVVHCPGQFSDHSSGDASYMVLHQLDYASKSVEDEYGWTTFQELSTVAPRCERHLVPHQERLHDYQRSWFVECHTLPDESKVPSNCYQHDSCDSESGNYGCSRNSGLCLFAWCVQHGDETSTEPSVTYHFAIFDINRWYHAQMPQTVRLAPGDEVCSFFAQYSFDGGAQGWCASPCLDVMADISSISRYSYPVGMACEQVPYPSTLRFSAIFMFSNCHVKAVFLGLQGQIIEDVVRAGPDVLLHPRTVHRQLVEARLALPSRTAVDAELREEMLSILLQHGHVEFIMSCVRQWSSGGASSRFGCDLKFLLHWVWSQAAKLKAAFDASATLLFDCTGIPLDEITARQLSDHCRQLGQLVEVLACMQDLQDVPGSVPAITDAGSEELAVKVTVLSLVALYSRVVLWCHMAGMLPEQPPAAAGSGHWLAVLRRAYDAERSELAERAALRASRLIYNCTVDREGVLMIDGLVALCGQPLSSIWLPPGSDGSVSPYPPADVHSMVAMLLLKSCELHLKSAIFFYFVLDFISVGTSDQANELLATCTSDVTSMLSMPEAKANLVAGFWLLDHDHVEESMERLCDPAVISCMEPWQSGRVLTRLLCLGHDGAALRIVRLRQTCCGADDDDETLPLVLAVLLANGCIHEAFHLLREENSRQTDSEKVAALFCILFDECYRKRQLGTILSLPLTVSEEEFLTTYLTRHSRQDLVVMHLLQSARIDDAVRLNNDIRMPERTMDVYARERSATRSTILDWYVRTMPAVTQRIASASSRLHPHTRRRKEPSRPLPMSAVTIKADRRRPASATATQSAAIGASSRSLLVDILDQIHELHEHEQRLRGAASDAGGFVCREPLVVGAPPSPLSRPFQQTPIDVRRGSRLVRPSPLRVDVGARDEAARMVSLKRPRSSAQFGQQHRESPSPKNIRLHSATPAAVGDQEAWSLLQTPAIHRKTPPSQVQPNSTSTPALKLASLFTPQSILKTRLPVGAVDAPESPAVSVSLSAEAVSTSTAVTSTARKGVSFAGLAASPGSASGDSPQPDSGSGAVAEEVGVKNRRLTAIVPAAGLKPLREFGLLLQTPPRYDRNPTSKAPEPAAGPSTSEMDVQPKCILFDEDEDDDDDDSEEMLSAEDTLFPDVAASDATASVSMLEQQQQTQQPSTNTDRIVITLADDDGYTVENSSSSSVAAATDVVGRPAESDHDRQPLNLVSGSSDDATSAAASEVPLEYSASSSSLATIERVSEDHPIVDLVADSMQKPVAATENVNNCESIVDRQQAAAEGQVASSPVQPLQTKECPTSDADLLLSRGLPAEQTRSPGASGDFEPQRSRAALPGDSNAFPGAEQGPLNVLAMSSGLELRSRLEAMARMEAAAASAAAARDQARDPVPTSAAIDAVSTELPPAVQASGLGPSPVKGRDSAAAAATAEPALPTGPSPAQAPTPDAPDAAALKPAEPVPIPGGAVAGSAMETAAPAAEQAEPAVCDDISAPPSVAAADEAPAATADAWPRADAAPFLFSPPHSIAAHPASSEAQHRQQQQRAAVRPFTFAAPAASIDDVEPRSLGRRSSRVRAAVGGRLDASAAAADALYAAVSGRVEPESSSDATGGRRSLRPRSSFKQDMVGAVGALLEQANVQLPETAAAAADDVAPGVRRTRRSSKAQPPPDAAGTAEAAVAAAANDPAAARRSSARSRPRSRQTSGDSAAAALPSTGGAAAAAQPPRDSEQTPADVREAVAAERAPLPPLLEDSAADEDGGGGRRLQPVAAPRAGRAGLRSRDKQPAAATLGVTGEDGDGTGPAAGAAAAAAPMLPPPSPFRDARRRPRSGQLPLVDGEANTTSGQAEATRTPAQIEPARDVTPSLPPAAYLVQSQRSSRSKIARPQPQSNTPINFTPTADSSVQMSNSSVSRRATALRSLVQTSASPLNMTLRSRSSKKP